MTHAPAAAARNTRNAAGKAIKARFEPAMEMPAKPNAGSSESQSAQGLIENPKGRKKRMCKKCLCFLEQLNEEKTMTKKEFLLIVSVGILAGIVFGLFASPRRSLVIGSFNGNHEDEDNDCDFDE